MTGYDVDTMLRKLDTIIELLESIESLLTPQEQETQQEQPTQQAQGEGDGSVQR